MNSISSRSVEVPVAHQGTYFFLSYAHAAPMFEREWPDAAPVLEADPAVNVFYRDLDQAVADRAAAGNDRRIGFFDQQVPQGADLKTTLSGALGAAEVFVPLYSPRYFSRSWPSWPMREQEVFRARLRVAGAVDPEQHIVPVLWTPVETWDQPPEAMQPLTIGAEEEDYQENGMRVLCLIASYRSVYERVLGELADRIVEVAEHAPLGPSKAPDLDTVLAAEPSAVTFLVAMLAGEVTTPVPPGPQPWWRAFPGRRIPPVAERAGNVAERLGLKVQVGEYVDVSTLFDETPGVVIIDPWVVGEPEQLGTRFSVLPPWIVPVVLDERQGSPGTLGPADQGSPIAAAVADELSRVRRGASVSRVQTMEQLDDVMPTLVARARRTYLREGPVFPPQGSAKRPARLKDERRRDAERSRTDE